VSRIHVHPATADRFDDVAALLAPRRADTPACWCLTYRVTNAENSALRGEDRPGRLREFCAQDPPPGVVAYVEGEPAGWCSFGPRQALPRLARSRTIPRLDDAPVWSVFCLVVRAGHRGKGLASEMVEAVVALAGSRGVPALEAYPVDPEGRRISASQAFVGTTSLFERAGFTRVAPTSSTSAGLRRWVMRREL
jgi:GNAT superfamily N-acetyltransferase